MLGKLLKYELRSTGRILLPLYPALILLSIMNRLLFSVMIDSGLMDIPRAVTSLLYGFLMIATFVITILVMIQRFHKNLLGEEGYLMFTLPVKTHQHMLAKLIASTIWFIASTIVSMISIFILTGPDDMKMLFEDISRANDAASQHGISLTLFTIELIILLIICVIYFILSIYSALSIGQLVSKNRILVSFGTYIGIATILQIITMVIGLSISANDRFFTALNAFFIPKNLHIMMLIPIGIVAILSVGHFFLAKIILTKKLNIE